MYHMLDVALALSCCKVLVGEGIERRHLDLYEFMLSRQVAGIAGSGERGIGALEVCRSAPANRIFIGISPMFRSFVKSRLRALPAIKPCRP